jgi:hypothetical protein
MVRTCLSFFIALLALLNIPCYILINCMTAYGFTHTQRIVLSSSVQEKKAARRKLIDEVERRRRENYRRFYEKMAAGQAKHESSLSNKIKITA